MNQYTNYDANMAIAMDTQKAYNRRAVQLAYDDVKELQRQKILEKRKTQTEVVSLRPNGELEIFTANLDIESRNRRLCNFKNPKLTRLYTEGEREDYFLLNALLADKDVDIFLSAQKAGDAKYLLKKFNAEGCEIFAPSKRVREEYTMKIWVVLIGECDKACFVPKEYGWQTSSKPARFIKKGSLLWKDVEKYAR